jgi:hypothetical protein
LQHGRFLAFAQFGQKHHLAVRKFQGVMVDVRRFLVDLTEDRRGVVHALDAAAEKAGRFDRNLFRESDLRSRQQADCRGAFLRRRKAARSGAEVSGGELVADLCRARRNAL